MFCRWIVEPSPFGRYLFAVKRDLRDYDAFDPSLEHAKLPSVKVLVQVAEIWLLPCSLVGGFCTWAGYCVEYNPPSYWILSECLSKTAMLFFYPQHS